jgi:hypothetical protein
MAGGGRASPSNNVGTRLLPRLVYVPTKKMNTPSLLFSTISEPMVDKLVTGECARFAQLDWSPFFSLSFAYKGLFIRHSPNLLTSCTPVHFELTYEHDYFESSSLRSTT